MNSSTKRSLELFVEAVEKLAVGTVHMTGMQTTTEVLQACQDLKVALAKDETILEVQ